MWRSVFLHEFIDEELRNCQALPGSVTPSSLGLTLLRDPPRQTNFVLITPGRGFGYRLTATLDEVIGVSGRVRLRYPMQGVTSRVPILRIGDAIDFWFQPLPTPEQASTPAMTTRARAGLRIASTEVDLGWLALPHRVFVDVRFDWHTNGQARLLLNRRLVGYQNAVSPTAQLTVSHVTFGLPDAQPSDTNPRYQIGRVFVRTLAAPDSLAVFSRWLPAIEAPDDDLFRRCQRSATLSVLAMVQRMREFMALVNANLSQPWSSESGPAGGPFTPEAARAHDLAIKAVVELKRMLRTGDFTDPERFLRPFTRFLRILHDALPTEFEALAQELVATSGVTEECRQILDRAVEKDRPELRALMDLLSETRARMLRIAGVA